MSIRIPPHLEVGVIELLETLKAKITGTTMPGEHNMRLARAKRRVTR